MRAVAYAVVTSGCLKQIRFEQLRWKQDWRFGTLGSGVVSPLLGWAGMGLVWLRMGLGVDTLLIVSFSWARASTWQLSGTKL